MVRVAGRSSLPGTLQAVQSLQTHPDFDLKVPNRVRALVGSFAAANPVRFHDVSGAGYRFLADAIIRLDPMNGQVPPGSSRRSASGGGLMPPDRG